MLGLQIVHLVNSETVGTNAQGPTSLKIKGWSVVSLTVADGDPGGPRGVVGWGRSCGLSGWCVVAILDLWLHLNPSLHHASEGQRMKLVGVNLLEQLLMTAAAPSKRYFSMIMGGLCHKSA